MARDLSVAVAQAGGERPNQVWAMDISYIPMVRSFVYTLRRRRLAQPQGSVLATVDHLGDGILYGGGRRGPEPIRKTRVLMQIKEVSSPRWTS